MAEITMVKESDLDDKQIEILNSINDKSCLITGCAGSGKSILALIKAKRIQSESSDYQIIVFTKSLCKYMNSGRTNLQLTNKFSYYEEWRWKKYLKHYANGKSFMVYDKDENGQRIDNMPKSDYIIVDEVQDFTEEQIREFLNATRKNIFFFGDSAQSMFSFRDTYPINDIPLLSQNNPIKVFNLYYNHRLPKPVAKIAQYVGVNLEKYDDNKYTSKVNDLPYILKYGSSDNPSEILKEQVVNIARIIRSNNLSDVGILLASREDVKLVSDTLNDVNIKMNHELKYESSENFKNNKDTLDFKTNNPKVLDYHCAKGLQFNTVFIPTIPDTHGNESWQTALYVAMTRTSHYLYMMYSDRLPYPLSNVPEALYRTSEVETTNDI